ncbi:hypothetical protein AVCANL279_06365 [Campylobacter canadensis]|uniref:YjiG family protein n=1 Tax=Campylobacter canadensis TaxID=449520 RepID=UPI0015540E25|nr:YjiG family protein [Campylobacter canadensis]MBZ7995000.1 hypothetical protein [Campylobacter canadensis]MBZ7996942.1 hypothetical protein [Campylobacter canadensis]MBZ8000421.1 hypothetical protein [Campylobacter canadensis]MBZ8002220.1 hypothetical protein [Campylobacter canadensis]MBZ8003053.1 hypothetical protein [Campylobacter canadensis]
MNKNPLDVFIEGAKKGFNIAVFSLLPNVLMAYVIAKMLTILGIMQLLAKIFSPIMSLFSLPGESIAVLLSAWLSVSAGVGMLISLISDNLLNDVQISIITPAIFLMGAQLQYMGRLLGVAGVRKKYWPLLMLTSILNAFIAMGFLAFYFKIS